MLQLGHAGEGVEMALPASRCDAELELQLGHAGEGVEIVLPMGKRAAYWCFNWATPVKAWRWFYCIWINCCLHASIGPRR